jgi:hypothetical protein
MEAIMHSQEFVQTMRAALDEVMTKIPTELATPAIKAHMAELILKAAAAGETNYERLVAEAANQIQTVLSVVA